MSIPPPLLFRQQTLDLLAEIEKDLAAPAGLGWQAQKGGAGQAMVKLFGRFLDIIVARLNKAPQQHFLAFLSEGGIDQLSPRASTTQLLFVPEKDARPAIPVPAGTQVATRASGDQPEIVFETVNDIHVIPTELVSCTALDQRTAADRTNKASGNEPGAFAAFRGERVRERMLYVREDNLLAFPDQATREHATVTLTFELDPVPPGEWQVAWFYYRDKTWHPLPYDDGGTDGANGLRQSGKVRFTAPPEMEAVDLQGQKGLWLKCQLTPTGERVAQFPQIRKITMAREIEVPEHPVTPKVFTAGQAGLAFTPVKPEDPFYPFGQFPATLDGFYVAADEAFSKVGATVELAFEGDGLPPGIDDASSLEALEVVWEYFGVQVGPNGQSQQGWQTLGTSRWGCPIMQFADRNDPRIRDITVQGSFGTRVVTIELPETYSDSEPPAGFPPGRLRRTISGRPFFDIEIPADCDELPAAVIARGRSYERERADFADTTCAFTAAGPGAVSFTVPQPGDAAAPQSAPQFAMTTVNGQQGLWIRARIVEGGYQVPQPAPGGPIQRLFVGNIPAPPPKPVPPLECQLRLTYRNYKLVDPPRDVQSYLGHTDGGWQAPEPGQPFAPFTASVEHEALYLGFRPLDTETAGKVAFPPNTWIELYLGVEETGDERTGARLLWEYCTGTAWQPLGVIDQTLDLWRSGTLGFFGPADHRPSKEFDIDAFWLRVSPVDGTAATSPRLSAVRLNVAPTINGETIVDEILGSSTGEKSQVFDLDWPPVSPDIVLEVQEPNEKTEASDQVWVAWERVPVLLGCGPASRCYTLDPTIGRVTFGDGVHGAIPPAGRDNIIVRRYRSHWGADGNLPAEAITVLRNPKGALNEIRRVVNPEPAAGGANLEETALVEQRGPFSLKNRSRAIAPEDYEWLGREISGARRVYCLPERKSDGTRAPGWVTVVVLPDATHTLTVQEGAPSSASDGSGRGGPAPTPTLVREVREYLTARALANLAGPSAVETSQAGQDRNGSSTTTADQPDLDQIHVTGANFVQVVVHATVSPKDRQKSDSTRQDILKQLAAFLDPVDGGPDRADPRVAGWEPGRGVYLSEIKAEIENVPGVDHAGEVWLETPSRQQQCLFPEPGTVLAVPMPAGSQVSTFDERIKGLLLAGLPAGTAADTIVAGGFSDDDSVVVGRLQDPEPFVRRITLARPGPGESATSPRIANRVVFDTPIDFGSRSAFDAWRLVEPGPSVATEDGSVAAPIDDSVDAFDFEEDASGRVHLLSVRVAGFAKNEPISLADLTRRGRRVDFIPIRDVSADQKLARVFLPRDHLVCSGNHEIVMAI